MYAHLGITRACIWVDIVATRAIERGEEILCDYDYGMRDDDDSHGDATSGSLVPKNRAQPPDAPAQQFDLASVRSGADSCSQWKVVGSYEGFKEAKNSRKRKHGSFRKHWTQI